jgi:hypothetical protein
MQRVQHFQTQKSPWTNRSWRKWTSLTNNHCRNSDYHIHVFNRSNIISFQNNKKCSMNSFRTYEHVYVAVVRLPVFEQSTLKLETKKKAIKISKIFFIIVLATLKVKQNPHLNVYTRISALKTCSSFAYLQKKLFCLTKLKKNEPNA